jgi:hypothetical protein
MLKSGLAFFHLRHNVDIMIASIAHAYIERGFSDLLGRTLGAADFDSNAGTPT